MDNYNKYLPSRKFVSVFLIIVIFISLFFVAKEIIILLGGRKLADNAKNGAVLTTIDAVAQKDSNGNGIPDWEEYLWGLDPTKNGPENKEFIAAKKKALTESGDIVPTDDSKKITDNDLLSRQFLAAIVSLQQTGDLNQDTMNSISQAIGKNIEATPIPDLYTNNMLSLQNDSATANEAYYNSLSDLISKYSNADIGNELTIIVQGMNDKDPQALYAAQTIAQAYRAFGHELIKIKVPRSLAFIQLDLANNYEKTGLSIIDLSKVLSDPLVGMKAIINYKKYSDGIAADLEKLYGILQPPQL